MGALPNPDILGAPIAFGMTPAEIKQEFFDYSTHLKQAQIDALTGRSGIPVMALARDPGELYGFPVASARVDRLEDGRFDFSEGEGTQAFVVLARDLFGDVADIVAMRGGPDGFVAPYIGSLAVLGAHNLGAPRLLGAGLAIHRTPFDWLRADRQGVVVLDEARATVELQNFGPFLAADIPHALALRNLLTPRSPSILVDQPTVERIAA